MSQHYESILTKVKIKQLTLGQQYDTNWKVSFYATEKERKLLFKRTSNIFLK